MRTIKHPLSGALYDLMPDGLIQVSKNGKTGLFTGQGVWTEGEIRQGAGGAGGRCVVHVGDSS